MNKIKELTNKRIDLFHLVVAEIIIGSLLVIIYKGLTIEQFLKLVDILVWPVVIFSALFFFRKIFTYLFFTFEEFNFFGIKGQLRNPIKVIDQIVEERIEQELGKKEREKKEKEYKKIIDDNKLELEKKEGEVEKINNFTRKVLDNFEKLYGEYKIINEKYTEYLNKEKEEKEKRYYVREAAKRMLKSIEEKDKKR